MAIVDPPEIFNFDNKPEGIIEMESWFNRFNSEINAVLTMIKLRVKDFGNSLFRTILYQYRK